MAIQFILGGSGTGKTRYIYEKMIAASMENGHRPIIFMLPEQSNMAAEQDMVSLHPMGGTMDISILSFTRLAFKVFDERNIHTRDILDDYGKSMLVMKLLREHQEELSYYGNMIGKQGFVEEAKSVLSEFFQYQITDPVLEELLKKISPDKTLYYKMMDLRLLLKAFCEEMQDSYMVTEQILSFLKEVVEESAFLRGADIYFDGFTGFTPVQYGVIEKLMRLNGNLYFSFTMEENLFGKNDYNRQGLFYLGKESVDRLCKLAQENQIAVLPHIGMNRNYRLESNEELYHLEQQLFRFPVKPYEKEAERISLLAANDSREEILFIGRTIKQYVMERGYRYRDFAVITGDLKEQAKLYSQVMEQLDIPCFLDFNETLSHNPIVEVAGMVMELFRKDFSYDSVFSLLKTGFFELDMNGVYELENYALKYGIKGYSRWNRAFKGGVKGLHALNEIRKQFMKQVEQLAPVFLKERAPAKEYLHALYDFMSTNKMAEKLQDKSVWLENRGSFREAKAYGQAYEKFVDVLDKTMDLLGEEELDREHFSDIFLTGIADIRLGVIPSTLDQVVIGDVERTRLHHVKILFTAGVNEGLLPGTGNRNGILVDKDRRQLFELAICLAPDSREEMFLQQFYFYLQVTQAAEKLIITYRNADERGAELRPSYFINRIRQVFPSLKVEKVSSWLEEALPATAWELSAWFADQLSEENVEDSSLYRVLSRVNPDRQERILEGYFYQNQAGVLNQAVARKLFGEHMIHSVSRLETYSGCAYQFFLKYGLKLAKREEYKVESNHIGTILHAVMERFFKKMNEEHSNPLNLTAEERSLLAEELTLQAAKEENDTIFESSFRNRHQLEVLVRIAVRSVENLCRHLGQGGMEPAYFEKTFSPEDKLSYIDMALEDGVKMELSGIVDRVDLKETEHAVYVKVVDYKSGAKDIDYVKMYEGRQLQLTVYMSVMLELLKRKYPEKEIIPTGMYYYHIYDPVIEETEEEKLETKRIESSRLSGLVNEEEESLCLMDGKTGQVVPVRYKKDGTPDSRNTALVKREELFQISEFVRSKMIEIGEDIIHGQIEMNPQKGGINSPCNYCDYKSICRFEAGTGGNAYRIAPKLDKKEARNRILGRMENDRRTEEGQNPAGGGNI